VTGTLPREEWGDVALDTMLAAAAGPGGKAPRRLGGMARPRVTLPHEFPDVVVQQPYNSPMRVRQLPDYEAAKRLGDKDAATRVIDNALHPDAMSQLTRLAHSNPVLVPVHKGHAKRGNQLPRAYAEALGVKLGLEVDTRIVQTNQPGRTGASKIERLFERAEFDGPVIPGRDYLIVDDAVTQGGTLAELRSYIESRGGRVVGATTLMGARDSHMLAPRRTTLQELRTKFPDLESWWKNHVGYTLDALTESEARALLDRRSTDQIRRFFGGRG
jgi:hypoxanthine-guanine phosphoribosyltransferase